MFLSLTNDTDLTEIESKIAEWSRLKISFYSLTALVLPPLY